MAGTAAGHGPHLPLRAVVRHPVAAHLHAGGAAHRGTRAAVDRSRRGRPRRRPQPVTVRAQLGPRLPHSRGVDRSQLRPLPVRRQALGIQNLVLLL